MSFKNVRAEIRNEPEKEACDKPCTFCGAMTEHKTLVMLGARCMRCYTAYCNEKRDWPNVTANLTAPGDRLAWVRRLEYRRDVLGERLNSSQVDAMQRALGPVMSAPEA